MHRPRRALLTIIRVTPGAEGPGRGGAELRARAGSSAAGVGPRARKGTGLRLGVPAAPGLHQLRDQAQVPLGLSFFCTRAVEAHPLLRP